jgi:enamine deaminase RidA (YjgF/YER057c/UK114 family)
MTTVDERLVALGLELPAVAKPAGAYIPAITSGNLVFTAGQLPSTAGVLPATGKVGADVTPEDAKQYARVCVLNGLAAAQSVIGSLDRIIKVVKVVGSSHPTPPSPDSPA